MKLLGIVGSAAEESYNRQLLQYIEKEFATKFDLELIEVKDLPLFDESNDQTESVAIQNLNRKVLRADGVIIATAEHNHTITPGLKSLIEWLSFKIHPLANKPVLIVGCSFYDQGTSRAQLHLRQILESPGVNAIAMPGNEFLLGNVKEAFDEFGNLKDDKTRTFLQATLQKFMKFISVVSKLDETKDQLPDEDLQARGSVATTIPDVDMSSDHWVEEAAAKVHPVKGDTYVQLDHGILTVDQIDELLKSMPFEITFVDGNNQFLYFNHTEDSKNMFAHRKPEQVGNPIGNCHPARTHEHVKQVISMLRAGKLDSFHMPVPHGPGKYVVHNYQALHDTDGNYSGINEYILDFQPIIDWYLKKTGKQLVGGKVDAVSGASKKDTVEKPDAVSSASKKDDTEKPDATSGASEKVSRQQPDAISGASEKD
ncbi:oxidoreductase [Lapidilactobacillus dextrinicus DSM 20335]|uniref:Oxidoreductase n=1 Tax=Lapidilactobacillus dextrinicus DSM 20335 TaxID=1423738 RepID=A0A0R2BGR5_9LACO|nr:NAD(P)H-dependent oxidoreductase [Lapidilactobacillus dextrinicus]KRM78648.1 oxidoreductase [Lapidilactobacillus dextrinicus DSM 20335]QFG46580.1 NADPH-dependent oxidoreductase [Lapidilactobacillus dextrinicus]